MRNYLTIFSLLLTFSLFGQCPISVTGPFNYFDETTQENFRWVIVSNPQNSNGTFEIPELDTIVNYSEVDTLWLGPTGPDYPCGITIQDQEQPDCRVFLNLSLPECTPSDECGNTFIGVEMLGAEACGQLEEVLLFFSGVVTPVDIRVSDFAGSTIFENPNYSTSNVFLILDIGNYSVTFEDQRGCRDTLDFFVEPTPCGTISGRSWLDEDGDGRQDPTELADVRSIVELYFFGNLLDTTSTDFDGLYSFEDLSQGRYQLRFQPFDDQYIPTQIIDNGNGSEDVDSDIGADGFTSEVSIFGNTQDLDAGWVTVPCAGLTLETFPDSLGASCTTGNQFVAVTSDSYPLTVNLLGSNNNLLDTALLVSPRLITFSDLPPGDYTVEVQRGSDCRLSESFTVQVFNFLEVGIVQTSDGCGGAVRLTAETFPSGLTGLTYAWSTGEFTQSILPSDLNATYSVTITADGGCFGTGSRRPFIAEPLTVEVDTLHQNTIGACGEGYVFNTAGGTVPRTVTITNPGGDTVFLRRYFGPTANLVWTFSDNGPNTVSVVDAAGCRFDSTFQVMGLDCGGIVGRSWLDANGNGLQDDMEDAPVFGTLRLFTAEGRFVKRAVVDANGEFAFPNTFSGSYFFTMVPNNQTFAPTLYQAGDDPTVDSDFGRTSYRSPVFTLASGEQITDLDIGWIGGNCDSLQIFTTPSEQEATCASGSQFIGVESPVYPVLVEVFALGENIPSDTFSVFNGEPVLVDDLTSEVYYIHASYSGGCFAWRNFDVLFSTADFAVEVLIDGDICSSTAIELTATVVPDTVSVVSYSWSTGETTQRITLDTITNDVYAVTVTNGEGCSAVGFYYPFENSIVTIQLPEQTPFACGSDSATLEVPAEYLYPNYTYRWFSNFNEVLIGPSVRVATPGQYRLIGQGPLGCTLSGSTEVVNRNLTGNVTLETFTIDSTCNGFECIGLAGIYDLDYENIDIFWTGPPEFTFENDTLGLASICTPFPGLYTVTLQSECDTLVLSYEVGSLSCTFLSGHLWMDNAGDCDLDADDIAAPGIVLTLTEETSGAVYYVITRADGYWSIELPAGTYVIEPVIGDGAPFTTCPDPTRVSLGEIPVTGVNVYLPVLVGCPQLRTSVTIPFLRRCFPSSAYVEYENTGSAVAEDAELTVTLDPLFLNISPNVPFSSQDGETFTFDLGDVPPFTSGRIWFTFTVSCQAQLGQSHCVEAAITPDAPCLPDENWSGALVDVTGAICDGDSVRFAIENIGDDQMTIPLNYIVIEDGIMFQEEPFINGFLVAGEIMEIALPADGGTYLVITNQEPNAPGPDEPSAVAEGCGANANGGVSRGFSNLWALNPGNLARSIACRENVGAYDPNDKIAYPTGYGEGQIPAGTRLEYDIRFQNTGTDTAFTVVIRDTISTALDLATFKPEAASHPYTVSIDTHRVATFTFENIQLPDSSVNLAASQGVVQFSIDHDATLIPGSLIDNEAAIYFDFNEPIITNVTRRRIAKEGLPVSLRTVLAQSIEVKVFPNPTDGLLKVELPAIENLPNDAQLVVMDVHGRPLLRRAYRQLGAGLDVGALPTGYYLLVVTDGAGRARGRAGFVRR